MNSFINTLTKPLGLLFSALILCALVSCGGGNDASSSSTTSTSNTSQSAATSTPAETKSNTLNDGQAGAASPSKMEIGKIYCVKCSSCHVPMDINLSFCPHRTN